MKRRKKYFVFISIALTAIFVLGLGLYFYYKDYYLREYSPFFTYSLGEYEVVSARTIKTGPHGSGITATEWHLRYRHQSGEEMSFIFRRGEFVGNELGYDVLNNATRTMAEYIENKVAKKFFPVFSIYEVFRLDDSSEAVYVSVDWNKTRWESKYKNDGYAHVLDLNNGLRLHSVTPQELVSDWFCEFEVNVITRERFKSYDDYFEVFESLEPMIGDLYTYLRQEHFEVRLHSDADWNDDFIGFYTYNNISDSFEKSFHHYFHHYWDYFA